MTAPAASPIAAPFTDITVPDNLKSGVKPDYYDPDINRTLEIAATLGLEFDMMSTSFFLSRETVVPVADLPSGIAFWRERLFAAMARNAGNAADYFKLPTNRVIELGTKVEI